MSLFQPHESYLHQPAKGVPAHTWWDRLTDAAWKRTLITLFVLACLTLTVAHPSMFGALPHSDDGEQHFARLIGLDHALRAGYIWPRYAPGMGYGYGMPVFNYYSPISLYPMEAIHLLGASFLDSFLLGMILYSFVGIAGAYLLGKVWGGPVMGLTTAVAFGYAPYLLVNWPRRGAVAEFLALGLVMWTLWAFFNAGQRGRRRDVLLAAGFFALTTMAHNITGLWLAGLLLAYSAVIWWTSADPRKAFVRLALAFIGGLGLSAVYWVPALLELDVVHIERATLNAGLLDYREHFQTLGEIFSLPHTADLTQFRTPFPRSLGWPQTALGLLGAALIVVRGKQREHLTGRASLRPLLLAIPLLIFLIFMMTNASALIWETVPLLRFFQFQWRLLGPASVLLALLCGAGVTLIAARIRSGVLRGLFVTLALLVTVAYSLPWLYGVYLPDKDATSILDAQNYERATEHVGGTAAGEYTPIWTEVMPNRDRLTGLYAESEAIPRLHPNDDVIVHAQRWGVLSAALTITSHEDTQLVFDWLYWPGFGATLDSDPVTITPTAPHGFVSITVPEGIHTITINFGLTPLRRAAGLASGVTGMLLLLALAGLRIWRRGASRHLPPPKEAVGWSKAAPAFAAALFVGLLSFGGKALVLDNIDTPIKQERFADGLESGLDVPVKANIGGMVTLLGYDLPQTQIAADEPLPLILYWELAGDSIEEDMSSNVIIRDAAGNIIHQQLDFYPADLPTSTWVPGFYVREPLQLDLPAGTPPGKYRLQVGMYSHQLGRNLDVLDTQNSPTGVLVDLTTIEVTRPRRPVHITDLPLSTTLEVKMTDELTLVHASAPPTNAEVGQQLPMVWYWRAADPPQPDLRARLIWRDTAGQNTTATEVVPLVTGFPLDRWQRRDLWRGVHLLHVPGALKTGSYEVAVQLVEPSGKPTGNTATIGTMEVSTPPRTFEPPETMGTYADIEWQNGIQLLGYDLEDTSIRHGDGLTITCYWRPQQAVNKSLTVFVHLYSDDGVIIAQRDQIPVNGSRSTTSWAPQEVIDDVYTLRIGEDIAPGTYRLRIGWYNASTGDQILTESGQAFFAIPQPITVESR